MRILIIEDDVDIAANVYDYLVARAHTVDHAADGVTGLHLAVTHPYDAILLDVEARDHVGIRGREIPIGAATRDAVAGAGTGGATPSGNANDRRPLPSSR